MCFNYRILLILVCLGLGFTGQTQNANFAYAYNFEGKNVTIDSESSDYFGYKYDSANAVLEKLIETLGKPTMAPPKLIMNNAEQKPASINLQSAQIYLEEKAYEICTSFGADSLSALAILLSHELIHYYEKHNWDNHFLTLYGSQMKTLDAAEWEDQIKLELQADQLGGFLANMAGYNTSGILEKLLTKIYSAYNLNDDSKTLHYPKLDERINIGLEGEKQLALMNQAFEISNFFCLAGQYELAYKYLDYIIITSNFQSRELHNNRGVLLGLSALSYIGESNMPFILPFEIDQTSRLTRKASNHQLSEKYISQAVSALKTSIAMDEKYFPAYINLASVYILKGEYFEAEYLSHKTIRKADPAVNQKEIAFAYNNLGIIKAMESAPGEAKEYFEKSIAVRSTELAKSNLMNISNSNDTSILTESQLEITMDGVSLNQLYSRIMRDEEHPISHIKINSDIDFYTIKKSNSHIYVDLQNFGDNGYHFFQKGKSITLDKDIINSKTSKKDLEKKLGIHEYEISLTNGVLRAYNSGQLFVRYNENENIEEFIVYHRSK